LIRCASSRLIKAVCSSACRFSGDVLGDRDYFDRLAGGIEDRRDDDVPGLKLALCGLALGGKRDFRVTLFAKNDVVGEVA
jgi:hypothetical protein